MKKTPREYQSVAVKAAVKALHGKLMRALVVMATGLGKTLTAAFIAKVLGSKRILFLVHNNFILEDAMKEFRQVFDEKTKMVTYNSLSDEGVREADIVFATWQTMGPDRKNWKPNYFDLIIVDEAHHSEADTYRPTLDYFRGAKLGLTATPDRADEEEDIRTVFGEPVVNITLEEAIARGWLPRIEYHVITDESLDDYALQQIAAEIREGKKRFTVAEVNRRIFIKKRDKEITRIINGYDEKAIVFCASITHAERIRKTLKLSATFHSGKGKTQKDSWNKNQKVLEQLHNGLLRRVCAVNAFNEGVNVPSVGLVAFCRVTGVLTVFRQQLGRGLRPGKEKLIVLDFVGNLERIQLVLQMMNKISDLHEQYTSRGEMEKEGYVRQQFEVSGKGFEFTFSDEVVDLMKVLEHCEREFYPTWEEASAVTQKLGINCYSAYCLRFKEDRRLPSRPDQTYKNFPGYALFFGNKNFEPYKTWQEAGRAARKLQIQNQRQYRRAKAYKKDPHLPSDPDAHYKNFPGWTVFLGGQNKSMIDNWRVGAEIVKKLKIKNSKEYMTRYKEDPRLPSSPSKRWLDFPGFPVFFGKPRKYKTWEEAMKSAVKLGISTQYSYTKEKRYKEDSRLPSIPERVYPDFPGWNTFLGKK